MKLKFKNNAGQKFQLPTDKTPENIIPSRELINNLKQSINKKSRVTYRYHNNG